jgi:hypothetical protein
MRQTGIRVLLEVEVNQKGRMVRMRLRERNTRALMVCRERVVVGYVEGLMGMGMGVHSLTGRKKMLVRWDGMRKRGL